MPIAIHAPNPQTPSPEGRGRERAPAAPARGAPLGRGGKFTNEVSKRGGGEK